MSKKKQTKKKQAHTQQRGDASLLQKKSASGNVAQVNQQLGEISAQYLKAVAQQDYEQAIAVAQQGMRLVPQHPAILMDLAFAYLRAKHYQTSYDTYLQVISVRPGQVDTNVYDGLVEACQQLGKIAEMRHYGALALRSKQGKALVDVFVIPHDAPPPLSDNPAENIIAYSLFGNLPRYCETAVLNVIEARELFSQWRCRFYCDDSVPVNIRERLQAEGAQVYLVSDKQRALGGLFWRFLVMDDPVVKRYLLRDADSLLSTREQFAVQQWLESDRWFHTMRDYFTHTELILAGMWGGCGGIFPNVEAMISQYIKTGQYLSGRVMDQHFLRYCIWPTLQQSFLEHDSQGFSDTGIPFPLHKVREGYECFSGFHVGGNISACQLALSIPDPEQKFATWQITDATGRVICRYRHAVHQGNVRVDVPWQYAINIQEAIWSVALDTNAKD